MKALVPFLLVTFFSCSKGLRDHKVRSTMYWSKHPSANEVKLIENNTDIIEYMTLANKKEGYKETPELVSLTKKQKKAVFRAINEIPQYIKDKIEKNLIGFQFVKNLGTSAATESVFEGDIGNKAFMVFDIKVLEKNANEWCSWKESSPFLKEENWDLKCTIAEDKNNNMKHAFQYIYLHEAGHVLNLTTPFLDFWDNWIETKEQLKKSSYAQISWDFKKVKNKNFEEEEKLVSKFEKRFYLRPKIKYYNPKEPLDLSNSTSVYKQLKKTNFPTLYSSINYADDWAETFVNYVHTQVLKYPFQIDIKYKGKVKYNYSDCWKEERCKEKREIIENFLNKKE